MYNKSKPLLYQYRSHKFHIAEALKDMPLNSKRRKNIEINVAYLLRAIKPYVRKYHPRLIEYAGKDIDALGKIAKMM